MPRILGGVQAGPSAGQTLEAGGDQPVHDLGIAVGTAGAQHAQHRVAGAREEGVEHQLLFNEQRMIDKFITKTVNGVKYYGCSGTPKPALQQLKKENMWIQILEGLHAEEAELLDLVKDKKVTSRYKITRQNVIDAFPELGLQNEA